MIRRRRPHLKHVSKTISPEVLLGQRGVNLAERVVLEMGFVWNVLHIESGIDATIEIRDPATGVTTNRIIQAQVKAVTNLMPTARKGFRSLATVPTYVIGWAAQHP